MFQDIFKKLKLIDEPIDVAPETSGHTKRSIVISGHVYDQTTSGLGDGLSVYAFQKNGPDDFVLKKKVHCRKDGSYFIQFNSTETADLLPESEIELFVYQGDKQMNLSSGGTININEKGDQYLKHLFIASTTMVKGIVKRNNLVNAAGCMVELYNDKDTDNPLLLNSAITDLNGKYEITYGEEITRNSLRLKFYNNEDVTIEPGPDTDLTAEPHSDIVKSVEEIVQSASDEVTEEPFIGQLVEDESEGKVYEVVAFTGSESPWVITQKKLVYWSDESDPDTKKFWKYLTGNDGKDYQILDRKIVYNTDGKSRICYKRIVDGEFDENQVIIYNMVTETYNSEWSPRLTTTNLQQVVNYKFTSDKLDIYTRLVTREEELIPAFRPSGSTSEFTLIRSRISGYNTEDTPYVTSLIGATEEDVQLLSQARDFNTQLKLDHEDLLFGLAKKGIKLDIATIFSTSEATLLTKIQNAVSDNIIPVQTDPSADLVEIKSKIVSMVTQDFGDLFNGINDATVKTVNEDVDKKTQFVSCMVEHSYDDKKPDQELGESKEFWKNQSFWDKLTMTGTEEKQLKRAIEYSEVCYNNDLFVNLFAPNETLNSFSSLLIMSKSEIKDLITANSSVLSTDYLPNELLTPDAYADYIYKKIETLYPTESLFLKLANDNCEFNSVEPLGEEFVEKFNVLKLSLISSTMNQPDFFYDISILNNIQINIEKGLIRDYINDNSSVFNDFFEYELRGGDQQDWIDFVALIQRVYSITKVDKFETLKALIEYGYYSAYDVVKAGKTAFYEKMEPVLQTENCRSVYNAAEYKVNKALALLNKYSSHSNSAMPTVISPKKLEKDTGKGVQLLSLPELEVIFGDQDVTDTKHEESVLGPAAYLVDILNVLKQYKVSTDKTLFDRLVDRRPDITQIPLNCTNAITPLPYIDLVMEILESEIFDMEFPNDTNPIVWDTTKTEEQLKTDPENKIYKVYEAIKSTQVASWLRQSFDLFSEEIKLFCKTLGINRTKLAEPFYNEANGDVNPYFDTLSFTKNDTLLFPGSAVRSFAALNFAGNVIVEDSAAPNLGTMMIKDFLIKAEMTLDEFKALISSYYVNPLANDTRFTIHYRGRQELGTAYMEFGTNTRRIEFVQRMYQFYRLMKTTGWSVQVLDAMILSNGNYQANYATQNESNNLITSATVEYIGKAKMNQDYLDLSDDQVTAIFGKAVVLDYEDATSFINRVFIENNLASEHKETFRTWITLGDTTGKPTGEVVYNSTGEIHLFMEYLREAMGLDEDELKALSLILETTAGAPIITATGIQNMVAAWQLAEGYNLDIAQLVDYCRLIQFDSTQLLADHVGELNSAQKMVIAHQADVSELQFLLYHEASQDELDKFDEKAVKIAENIIEKKDELEPELPEGEVEHSPEAKVDWSDALSTAIEEQLQLNTNLDSAFVVKAIEDQSISLKSVVEYLVDSTFVNKLAVSSAIKHCLKGFSLCEIMEITNDDLEFIDSSPIDLFKLPLNTSGSVTFEHFDKLSKICQSDMFLKEEKNRFEFYNLIAGSIKTDVDAVLSDYITWSGVLSNWVHNEKSNPDPNKSDYYNDDLTWFVQTGEVNHFLTRYNIDNATAIDWIKWESIDETTVDGIATIARAKANSAIYKAEMTEGRNKLRSKQRDVLVQYLCEKELLEINPRFTDVSDLFSYFLIDTQMTPAVSSSRILQATLAVQSFIQRIQLGLEPDSVLSKEDAKKWEWMGLYRVWEANRKIFLYPENWLEPELRDNKTPFFKELEKELTGKEITKEVVDSSYMDYVSKLEKVSNIEMCQMYNEEHDSFSVLHVIGRTRLEPREYYYRKLVNESYWTPWEKMSVEINSEHIAPVVIKDRLVTFWLECSDVAKEPTDDDLTVKTESPEVKAKRAQKQLQLQLCWSELIDNKWTGKQSCTEKVFIDNPDTDEKYDLRLVYHEGDTNYLHILNDPNNYIEDNKGYSFEVECFNHVHLTKAASFEGKEYIMPIGMHTIGQKVEMTEGKDWISLPVASNNNSGSAHSTHVVENQKGETRLIYPHQYKDFICNAPFVVENNIQSVVFVPTVKAEKNSVILKKVVRHIHVTKKYRPLKRYYKPARKYRRAYRKYHAWDERRELQMPEFFTYEHRDYSIVVQTPSKEEVTFEEVKIDPEAKEAPVFKPVMNASLGYHPFMETLRANLQKYGIDGILDPLGVDDKNHQLLPQQANKNYLRDFELNNEVVLNTLKDDEVAVDNLKYIAEQFEYGLNGTYSLYNWELFFHIPYLLSNRFLIEGNFKEALRWIHYIFDPRETEGNTPAKYWKFKPFAEYNATVGIEDLLYDLNINGEDDPENVEFNKQIEAWSNDPFKPHNIALMRPSAYMKAVVMRYLDIIIAHGDDLFRIDTTESINEAMQYYMIAAQLLGRKPEVVETEILTPKSYKDMESGGMSNGIEYFEETLIKPENAVCLEKYVESNELEVASQPFTKDRYLKGMVKDVYGAIDTSEQVFKLYFGIPKNGKMLAYWDQIADRLFKIRNSLNIDGIKRTVALFAPPIDPGMLIRARQAGISIQDIMRNADANNTQYRFQTLLQRALEICNEVKSLGSQLLSALEKGDNEKIAKLRVGHEKALTEMVTAIKEKSVEEAEENIEQLKLQKDHVQFRENYYRKKKKISGKEKQQLDYMDSAQKKQIISQALQLSASAVDLIPTIKAGASGFGGSPHFVTEAGGRMIAESMRTASSALSMLSSVESYKGTRSGIIAGYDRRKEDWTFQADVAKRELAQLDKQEITAEIRKELAKLDQQNHLKQVEQLQESYDVLTTKFTNEELYLWMAGEINTLYRSAFDMAYKMAKQAEGAYNFELCPESPKYFVSTDHFNAQNKGLLSGEKLYLDLKKMESEYLADHKRRYELTKHVSLAMLDPQKILDLRKGAEGENPGATCEFTIPEALFDMDHPGQCNRRIKSVSLTIPCVTGAYTSVSANLTLKSSSVVTVDNPEGIQLEAKRSSMATSSAVSDSGLFELNFNDARYLPFEGAGAASSWTLTLPDKVRQFDYNSITDVIMHINYTAEDGLSRTEVENNLVNNLIDQAKDQVLVSMFSLKAQYPEAWAKVGSEEVNIRIKKSQLPFYLQGESINIAGLERTRLSGSTQSTHEPGTQDTFADLNTIDDSQTVTIPVVADMGNTDDVMIVMKYTIS